MLPSFQTSSSEDYPDTNDDKQCGSAAGHRLSSSQLRQIRQSERSLEYGESSPRADTHLTNAVRAVCETILDSIDSFRPTVDDAAQ